VDFEWDPDKAAANRKRHRVDVIEAAGVLDDPLSTTFPDETHSEQEMRFLTIGASMKGGVRGKYVARLRKGSNLVPADRTR
jgi:uncharacterized protein